MGRGIRFLFFLLPDGRKMGEIETALSERCTTKGQAETITTCVGGYSSWTEENCFTFRGAQCWNKTPERLAGHCPASEISNPY